MSKFPVRIVTAAVLFIMQGAFFASQAYQCYTIKVIYKTCHFPPVFTVHCIQLHLILECFNSIIVKSTFLLHHIVSK